MFKIHGNSLSIPCNKVLYTCNFLGIDYEWIEKEFRNGEMKTPEYLALHPAGKVPVMEDDGFILFESEAICRYLCAKSGSALYPEEIQARALMDQWNAFSVNHVGLAMVKVVFNRLIAPMFDLPVDENSLKEGEEWLERYLPIVDQRLSESDYLAGDAITLADITLLSFVETADQAKVSLAPYPQLSKWLSGLQAQEFWKKAHLQTAASSLASIGDGTGAD